MAEQYTPEQLWKLCEKLSAELKEAVFSQETADNVWNACERNGVEKISEVARLTGYVLLGVLPPEDFQKGLEKELKLEKDMAKKVAQEINRFVFYPVKPALEQLYKMEIGPSEKEAGKKPEAAILIKEPAADQEPRKEDSYREPIE